MKSPLPKKLQVALVLNIASVAMMLPTTKQEETPLEYKIPTPASPPDPLDPLTQIQAKTDRFYGLRDMDDQIETLYRQK